MHGAIVLQEDLYAGRFGQRAAAGILYAGSCTLPTTAQATVTIPITLKATPAAPTKMARKVSAPLCPAQ